MGERLKTMFRIDRVMPLVTTVGAAGALTGNLIGLIPLSVPEQIVVGLLGLLAIDSLTERVLSLNRIERQLVELKSSRGGLLPRVQMPSIATQASSAQEIWLLAVHGTSAIPPNISFFDHQIQRGVKIKIALLDPDSSAAVDAFALFRGEASASDAIRLSLSHMAALSSRNAPGTLEVRLTPTFMPFSMLATDPRRRSGLMNVEFHALAGGLDGRPHVRLKAVDDLHWFEHYRSEFESMWERSRPWQCP